MTDSSLAWELRQEWLRLVPREFLNASVYDLDNSVRVPVERWIANLTDHEGDARVRGPNLLLIGPVGAGKTHAAFAALRTIFFEGTPSLQRWVGNDLLRRDFTYWSAPDALARLRDHDATVMPRLLQPQVLFFDDVGSVKPTDWALEQLFNIFNTRRAELRPTLATSNYGLEELGRHLGEATYSRLVGDAAVVHVQHQDRRRRPKLAVVEGS